MHIIHFRVRCILLLTCMSLQCQDCAEFANMGLARGMEVNKTGSIVSTRTVRQAYCDTIAVLLLIESCHNMICVCCVCVCCVCVCVAGLCSRSGQTARTVMMPAFWTTLHAYRYTGVPKFWTYGSVLCMRQTLSRTLRSQKTYYFLNGPKTYVPGGTLTLLSLCACGVLC